MSIVKPILILALLLTTLLAKSVNAAWFPKSFKADYQSVSKGFFSEKEVSHDAKLFYKYPKRLKLIEVKKKGKTILVFNPFETYYFKEASLKGNPNELTIKKSSQSDLGGLFDTLIKFGLKNNDQYSVVSKNKVSTLKFTKAGLEKLQLKEVVMTFKSKGSLFKNLKSMLLTLDSGTKLDLRNFKINTTVKLSKEDFNFKTPPNTNVSRE